MVDGGAEQVVAKAVVARHARHEQGAAALLRRPSEGLRNGTGGEHDPGFGRLGKRGHDALAHCRVVGRAIPAAIRRQDVQDLDGRLQLPAERQGPLDGPIATCAQVGRDENGLACPVHV